MKTGVGPKPCCQDPNNLDITSPPRPVSGMHLGQPSTATATVRTCRVCRCRHHELNIDPVKFQVRT